MSFGTVPCSLYILQIGHLLKGEFMGPLLSREMILLRKVSCMKSQFLALSNSLKISDSSDSLILQALTHGSGQKGMQSFLDCLWWEVPGSRDIVMLAIPVWGPGHQTLH